MASAVSILSTIIWSRSDRRFGPGAFDNHTNPELLAQTLIKPIDLLQTGIIPAAQLCNIQYLDLVKDPLITLNSIYEYFGIKFSAAARTAVQTYLAEHPRTERPLHRYQADGVSKAERSALQKYQAYFSVPSEA